jgi:hypothetical protein
VAVSKAAKLPEALGSSHNPKHSKQREIRVRIGSQMPVRASALNLQWKEKEDKAAI